MIEEDKANNKISANIYMFSMAPFSVFNVYEVYFLPKLTR